VNGWGKNRPRSLGASWGERKGHPLSGTRETWVARRIVPHELTAIIAASKLASSPRLKARQTL